jgi:hypothetical protein
MVIRAEHPHPAMALPVASTRTFGGSSPEAVESFTKRTKPPKVLVLCYLIAIDLLLYCYLTPRKRICLNLRFYFHATQLKDATWQNEPNWRNTPERREA